MPSRDEHLAQAKHNARFYGSFDRSVFKDWAVTVLFYTSLHYIDAFLAHRANIHPVKHKTRDNAVGTVAELKPIFGHYSALKNASFNARYMPPTQFTDNHVVALENTHLAKIKAAIGQHIQIG